MLAETIDPDLEVSYAAAILMPAASGRVDPDYRGAVEAWDRGDHREHAAFRLQSEFESDVDDALVALQVEARERGDETQVERLRRARARREPCRGRPMLDADREREPVTDWDHKRPGRYYLVRNRHGDLAAHVVAEVVDWSNVEDNVALPGFAGCSVVSRREAETDRDYRAAIEAWETRDDRAFDLWMERAMRALDEEQRRGVDPLADTVVAMQFERITLELEAEADDEAALPALMEIAGLRERSDLLRMAWAALGDRQVAALMAALGVAVTRVSRAIETGDDQEASRWEAVLRSIKAVLAMP